MKEVYEETIVQYINDNGKTFYESSPRMPVKVLADMLQTHTPDTLASNFGVSNYYKNLFYTGDKNKKKFAFDFRDFFLTTEYNGQAMPTAETITPKIVQTPTPQLTFDTEPTYKYLRDYTVSLQLKDPESGAITDFDTALRSVSRPICTLDEYITFIGGTKSPEMISIDKYGLEVPVVIKNYTPYPMGSYETPKGIFDSKNLEAFARFSFRTDWAKRIQAYRKKIHERQITVK